MAYGNYQQNNGYQRGGQQQGATAQSDNVSNTGVSFINERAGKFMGFNYWGRMVSLDIGTCPAGVPLTWDVKKNAQTFRQVIPFTSLADLCEMCDEVYTSIKSTGKFTPVGVRLGSKKDGIVELSDGSNIKMPTGIYLVVYKGIDNTNRTNILDFYQFDSTSFIRNYDHATGSGSEDINKLGEFKKFRRAVEQAANAFTMAQAHSISELKKTDKMASFKALAAISAALGVDMSKELLEKKTTGTSSYNRGQAQPNGGYQRKPYSGGNQKGQYNGPRQQSTFERPPQQQSYQHAVAAAVVDEPVDIKLDVSNLQNVSLSDFANG